MRTPLPPNPPTCSQPAQSITTSPALRLTSGDLARRPVLIEVPRREVGAPARQRHLLENITTNAASSSAGGTIRATCSPRRSCWARATSSRQLGRRTLDAEGAEAGGTTTVNGEIQLTVSRNCAGKAK